MSPATYEVSMLSKNVIMKPKIVLILICSFFSKLFSSDIIAQPIDLSSESWKFQQGDSMAWATPQYDDADWQNIAVGMPWESALNIQYDGMAWYRRSVIVPQELQKAVKKNGSMVLKLGLIDDADETYFNGVKIGSNGKMPPESLSAWDVPRVYLVPMKLIKWDEPNVIAVRVSDWGGGGGMYSGEYVLEATTWKNKFKILIENAHTTNAFDLYEPVVIKAQLANSSDQKLEGTLICEIKDFMGHTLEKQSQEVKVLRGVVTKVTDFIFNIPQEGFYVSTFTFKDKKGYSIKEKKGFAIAPECVKPEPSRPLDFDAYWEKARAELAQIPPEFKLMPLPKWSTLAVDVYEVEMKSLGNVRVRGYYAQPKGKTGMAAVLHVQGYSSVMQPFDLDKNVAAFFLNIRGHGNSRDDINPGFPGFLLKGLDNKDTYIYRGAYMDCIRAVDFLCSRPEVDTNRIAVSGGSQGGALSIATASLDKRIKLCMPDVPFLSDFPNYFKIAHWPLEEFRHYISKTGKTWEDVYSVLNYIDIKNHAVNVTCPVIMAVGLFDDICPPPINFAAYNNLSSLEKEYHLYPQSGHSVPGSHHTLKMKWLYKHFGLLP